MTTVQNGVHHFRFQILQFIVKNFIFLFFIFYFFIFIFLRPKWYTSMNCFESNLMCKLYYYAAHSHICSWKCSHKTFAKHFSKTQNFWYIPNCPLFLYFSLGKIILYLAWTPAHIFLPPPLTTPRPFSESEPDYEAVFSELNLSTTEINFRLFFKLKNARLLWPGYALTYPFRH